MIKLIHNILDTRVFQASGDIELDTANTPEAWRAISLVAREKRLKMPVMTSIPGEPVHVFVYADKGNGKDWETAIKAQQELLASPDLQTRLNAARALFKLGE
jgi:uncharacterized protein (DUF2126 family)